MSLTDRTESILGAENALSPSALLELAIKSNNQDNIHNAKCRHMKLKKNLLSSDMNKDKNRSISSSQTY